MIFNRKNIPIAIIICFAALLLSLNFKVAGSIPEKFYIHLNQPFYINGETVWFKIYNTNYKEHEDHSKVLYVNIHDKKGSLLIQQKLELKEGKAYGSIDIPLTWKEDYYYLTCFTKWNLQFENSDLEIHRIAVFNPFNQTYLHSNSKETIETNHKEPQESLIIDLDKESYSRHDKVQIHISTSNKQLGNFSVSVHAMHGLSEDVNVDLTDVKYEKIFSSKKEKELIITGSVIDNTSGDNVVSNVLSLYKVGTNEFINTSSNDGSIQIPIGQTGNSASYQLFNMNPYQKTIPKFTLNITAEKLLGLDGIHKQLMRNEQIIDYLKNVVLNQKIREIFEEQKIDSIESKFFSTIPLKADKVYIMEKYKSLKTFEEFLREIVFYADFQKEDSITTIRLKNIETKRFFMEKPWYLIDGYLTRDETLVMAIPFKNLVQVEIFNTNKSILGQLQAVMIRSGMIAVYTDNLYMRDKIEAQPNIFSFNGYTTSKDFAGVKEASPSEARESPDFRPLLYWNPNVELGENTSIEFVTSDLLGKFIVEVQALTSDGQRLSGSRVFSVEN